MQTKVFVLAALLLGAFSPIFAQTSVLTQHNDISRTGQNLNETILTPANVSSGNFGKLFSLPVDGWVLAQPLYMPGLTVGGAAHNVVFVETENDSVYAFDADSGGAPLWQASMVAAAHGAAAGATPDPQSDTGCGDLPEYGITGTPVIDPVSGTMYVVSKTYENNYPVQRLHALDVKTGLEKFGGPVVISASVAGTGTGSSNGVLKFDPKWENQRPGLLLVNGTVYIAFGAHCDFGPFHGWLMAYNAATLAQTAVFLSTPNGTGSGFWMGGAGLAADTENGETRMFLPTGNGTYDATTPYATNSMDYGDDILRLNLTSGMKVEDAFTPKDQATRAVTDLDLGSGGALILPDQTGPYPHLLVLTGKGNEIFLVNRDNMGGYSTTSNNVVQEIDNEDTYLWGMPAYWNGNIYTWTAIDWLKQFSISSGVISETPVNKGLYVTTTGLGSTPSISANGTSNAILWVVDWSVYPEVVYAVEATNVSTTLWSSAANSARDSAGPNSKFVIPTIANGKVYVASTSDVTVYGLLPVPDFALGLTANSLSIEQGSSGTDTVTITDLDGFSGAVVLKASNLPAGVTVSFAASATGASATATFTVAGSAVAGTYPVTITGTSGALVHSVTLNLVVEGTPGFSIKATPSSLAVQQGTTVSSAIALTPVNGFSGAATFSVSGLPTGVTASFSPASSASGSTLTLMASSGAWVGSFAVTVTATAAGLVKTVPISLSVTHGLSLSNVQLVNLATGACFDVNGISKAVGAMISQWAPCWGGGNELWNLTAVTSGAYRVTSINSGLTLDVSASSTMAGVVVVQDTYQSLASQQWKFQKTSDGYFQLVNVNSAMCLDGVETSLSQGLETQQQVCSSSATQKWSLVPLTSTTMVNLSAFYNVNAIGWDGKPVLNGGLDSGGNAYPESQLGSSYSFYGYPFTFGPADVPDGVSSTTVALPNGQYNGLYFLAAGVDGMEPNQTFKVNYSDGTSATLVQGVSDWGVDDWPDPAPLYANEYAALTSAYRLVANGSQDQRPFQLYGFTMTLDSTRTAVSITLPNNRNVVVLAITMGQ